MEGLEVEGGFHALDGLEQDRQVKQALHDFGHSKQTNERLINE